MIFSNDPKELEEQLKHVKIQTMEEYLKEVRQLTQAHKQLQGFTHDLQNKFNIMTFERNLYKNDLMRSRERYKDLEKENKDLLFKLENIHSSLLRYEREVEDYNTINLELRDELKRQLEVSKLLAESNERIREELEETQYKLDHCLLWQIERKVDK